MEKENFDELLKEDEPESWTADELATVLGLKKVKGQNGGQAPYQLDVKGLLVNCIRDMIISRENLKRQQVGLKPIIVPKNITDPFKKG